MRLARSFKKNNGRRWELIDKRQHYGPLTDVEDVELTQLQEWCREWVNKRHPIDTETTGTFFKRGGIH